MPKYDFGGLGRRKRLFPMPVEPFIDHSKLRNAHAVVYGAVMRLALHYWATECEELPDSPEELKAISRCPDHYWRKHRDSILQIFADTRPALDKYYETRVSRRTNLKDLSARATGVRALKVARQRDAEVARRMGLTDLSIPRKQPRRQDFIPPIITNPTRKRWVD